MIIFNIENGSERQVQNNSAYNIGDCFEKIRGKWEVICIETAHCRCTFCRMLNGGHSNVQKG